MRSPELPGAGFLDLLVDDLDPVRPAAGWLRAVLGWSAASGLFVGLAILAAGPLRDGVTDALVSSPRLAAEIGLGTMAALALIAAGLELGVPGGPRASRLLAPAALLVAGWLSLTVIVPASSSVDFSMDGKRAHCFVESLLFALPPLGLALVYLRTRCARLPATAGAIAGAAAAALPALFMQLACMYDPSHALRFHFSPILLIALAGACLGHLLLPSD